MIVNKGKTKFNITKGVKLEIGWKLSYTHK